MKLRKVGNSYVVSIPASKVRLLGWELRDEIDASAVGDQLVLRKVRTEE